MSTWGIAFISLGLLLVAYHNWLGLAIVLIGFAMILIARRPKKESQQNRSRKSTST
ncbi:PTS system, mannose/fructose/sorbose family, IIC component [Lactococcus lactis subsp. lactis]|nr:PTS system, mannose/fructose/sorbose family, IIC component [Lactococcus lactis subsp. lactis]